MKHPSCQDAFRRWKAGAIAAALAAGTAEMAVAQQPSPSLAKFVQPAANRQFVSASPDWALATIRAGDASSPAARKQAVGILGTTFWQADAETEMALIFALRSDPSDTVREHAAATIASARFVTPKVFASIQCCASGNFKDGYPCETSASVRSQASEALRKHARPASDEQIIAMQRETYRSKTTVKTKTRDGSEESSPPEKKAETPAAPTVGSPISVAPTIAPPIPGAPTLGRPIPTEAPRDVPAVKTVSIPLPPAPKMKDADRLAPTAKAPVDLPPVPVDNRNLSMRQRRAELREMGLADPSLTQFQNEVGAPPPKLDGQQSAGLFKGVLGGSPAPAPVQATASNEKSSAVVAARPTPPNTPTEEPMIPRPVPWSQFFARFRPSATGNDVTPIEAQAVTQDGTVVPATTPSSSSPGLMSRMFGRPSAASSTSPAAPPSEPTRRSEGLVAAPSSPTPSLRLP